MQERFKRPHKKSQEVRVSCHTVPGREVSVLPGPLPNLYRAWWTVSYGGVGVGVPRHTVKLQQNIHNKQPVQALLLEG